MRSFISFVNSLGSKSALENIRASVSCCKINVSDLVEQKVSCSKRYDLTYFSATRRCICVVTCKYNTS